MKQLIFILSMILLSSMSASAVHHRPKGQPAASVASFFDFMGKDDEGFGQNDDDDDDHNRNGDNNNKAEDNDDEEDNDDDDDDEKRECQRLHPARTRFFQGEWALLD